MKGLYDAVLYSYSQKSGYESKPVPIGKINEVCVTTSPYEATSISFDAELNPDAYRKIFEGETMPIGDFAFNTSRLWAVPVLSIKKVIFNDPATIVIWDDNTKTVVKCMEGDRFDKETGLALCIAKKYLGKDFHKTFKKWCKEEEQSTKKDILRFGNCTEIIAEGLSKMAETIQDNFSEITKMAELGDIDIEASGFFTGTCFENMVDGLILIR